MTCRVFPIIHVVLFALAVHPGFANAQEEVGSGFEGTWLIRRVSADELSLQLTLDEPSVTTSGALDGRMERTGRIGRWRGAPPALETSPDPVPLTATTDDVGYVHLRAGSWRARLALVAEGVAVFVADGGEEVGLAYRTGPLPAELLGDWAHVEPHPTGPRSRRLRVDEDEVTFFDRHGRATQTRAVGLPPRGSRPRLALLPDRGSARAVELSRIERGYLALEVGGDELELIHDAPETGDAPDWLEAEPIVLEPDLERSGELVGRWLGARAERELLVGGLTIGVRDSGQPLVTRSTLRPPFEMLADVAWLTPDGGPTTPVALLVPEGDSVVEYRLWTDDEGGAEWPRGESRYTRLYPTTHVPNELRGAWRRVEPDGTEVTVEIFTDRWHWGDPAEMVPIIGLVVGDGALAIATLPDDYASRLYRVWPLPSGGLVEADGTVWHRVDP